MRRKDRQMDEAFAINVIDKSNYMVLSLSDNSNPYCIPISGVRDGQYIYFHCALEGKKIDILNKNNQVCICAVGNCKPRAKDFTLEYESAIIFGKAIQVKEKEEKLHALHLICHKYALENIDNIDIAIKRSFERTNIIKIKIESITGKRKKYGKDGKELKYGKEE